MSRLYPWLQRAAPAAAPIVLALWPTIALAQTVTPATQAAPVLPGGLDNVFLALLLTLVGGCLGGAVYELLSLQGNVELPHRYHADEVSPDDKYRVAGYAIAGNLFDLGLTARIFIGGMSALAALLLVTPTDVFKLLATSLVAGSAGASVFDMLRARLTATVAQADAALTRANLGQLEAKLDEISRVYGQLRGKLETAAQAGAPQPLAPLPNGDRDVEPAPSAPALPTGAMQELERLLGEAKGLATAAHPRR